MVDDDLRWFTMVYDGLGITMVFDCLLWGTMGYDGLGITMAVDGIQWFAMAYDWSLRGGTQPKKSHRGKFEKKKAKFSIPY